MNSGNLCNVAGCHAQKGAVLIVGLLLITVLTIVGVSAAQSNVTQQRLANNYRFSIEAMNNAEFGFISTLNVINDQKLSVGGFDDELDLNGDGILDDGLRFEVADPDRNVFFNVVIVDDDDGDGNPAVDSNGIVRLVSQGISSIGSTRTVDVRIGAALEVGGGYSLKRAILAEGSIEFSGNSVFYGSNQDIHSNADIIQADHPYTGGVISAVGIVDGTPDGGGTAESNAAYVDIPKVEPSMFAEYADYTFDSDGRIYDDAGTLIAVGEFNGWKFSSDKWTTVGDTVLGGMLYFRGEYGNVVIASAPGTESDRWLISILADGYIEVSGNPVLANYTDPDDPPAIQAIMFMSGTDLKINGNPGQVYNGILAAKEQFDISGNPFIEGAIIAEGASSDSDLVIANKVSGVMKQSYDGSFLFPTLGGDGDATAIVLSWRDRDVARNSGVFAPFADTNGI